METTRPRLWTRDFLVVSLVNFVVALNFYLLMIVISEYAMSQFDSSPGEAGFAASVFIIGALVARLFAGHWITRIGYKKMLCVGVLAGFAMTLVYFGVNSSILLLVVRFLHGVAFGITTTAAGTIVSVIIPGERRGEGIGYYSLSQTLATAIGPFIGLFLIQHGSYSVIFGACALVSAVSLLMAPFLSLRKVEFIGEKTEGAREFKLSNLVEFRVVPISSICLLMYMCYSSIVSFLGVYAREIDLVDAASFFFIVYAVAVLVSRPAVGRLFDIKGENSIMYPAIMVFGSGLLLFSRGYHGYELLFAAALIGFGFGAIQSSSQAIAVKLTPPHRLGLANSTFFLLLDIGMGIGPLMIGLVVPFTGYRGMYMAVAMIALTCLPLYYCFHGRLTGAGKDSGNATQPGALEQYE